MQSSRVGDSGEQIPSASEISAVSTKKSVPAWAKVLIGFALPRLMFGAVVLVFIIFLSYFGLDMATGTEFGAALQNASVDTLTYLERLSHGDLGLTTAGSETLLPRPTIEVVGERIPRSLGLVGISILLAAVVGIFLGVAAARSGSQRSLGILVATLVGVSVPSFFAAFLLQWIFITLTQKAGRSFLPMGGFGWDVHLILPALVLAARPVAQITRMSFVSIREVLEQDYVRTAISKGMPRNRVMAVHVMRNAAIPILTTIGVSLRFALSSLPVVELYFGWPGAGFTLLKGIAEGDTNITIALALCLGITFILVNMLLEISYRLIDPRLSDREAGAQRAQREGVIRGVQNAWHGLLGLLRDNPISRMFLPDESASLQPLDRWTDRPDEDGDRAALVKNRLWGSWRALLVNLPLVVGGVLVAGLLLIMLLGPVLAPNNPLQTQGLTQIDGEYHVPPFPPSVEYPWGTDILGRGLLSLILAGAQQTLTLAMLAVAARIGVGVVAGALAGWNPGGAIDRLISSLSEVISAFPTLLIAMILVLALGIRKGMTPFIIAMCFVGWGEIMQFVRGEVISIRPRPFIESAHATGVRTPGILLRHVLPNLFSSLISIAALEMGAVLMLLGELGFISIFIGGGSLISLPSATFLYSDVPEWGALLSDVRYQVRSYPWTGFYPMMAFFIAILSFNLFGEGFRRMVMEGNQLLNRLFNRTTFFVVLAGVLGYNWLSANGGTLPFYKQQAVQFDGQRAMQHVSVLANERIFGRALGSPGTDLAAIYIAREFEAQGLQPGAGSSYFQARKRSYESLNSIPALVIEDGGPTPVYGVDYAVYPGRNVSAGFGSGPIRFVALGEDAAIPTPGWSYYYPELDGYDFSDDVLLVISNENASYLASKHKRGMLVVSETTDPFTRRFTLSGRSGLDWNIQTRERSGSETPYLWISEELADRLLAQTGQDVDALRRESERRSMEQVIEQPVPMRVSLAIDGALVEDQPVNNVIGLWPGTVGYDYCADCLGKKLIVVMAQYDSPPVGPGGIYPAANDNASGVAVLMETLRTMKASQYQPYRSFLFVGFSGEGLDGGELVQPADISKVLQASPSFRNFEPEAIVILRGLGGGNGHRLEISAEGSLRLAELFEKAARVVGTRTVRTADPIDISVIYDQGNSFLQAGQDAPVVRLFWEGWEEYSRSPQDTLDMVSQQNLEDAGEALAMALMMMGREP